MSKEENNLFLKRAMIVSAIILFGSFLSFWAYFYYQILRVVVTITAVAYIIYHHKKTKEYDYLMVGVAILFNPIAPLFFDRAIWLFFDFVAGFIFLNKTGKL